MSPKLKSFLNNFLRFGLSAVLLYWLYTQIDVQKTADVIKSANLTYIFYAGLVFWVINFAILWRWVIYIRALDLQAPLISIVRFFFIGLFGNLFLPSAIGGDVIKILGLCKYSDQKPKVVATVLLDRLSGFASMVIVATIAFVFGLKYIEDISIIISVVGMSVLLSLFALVLLNEKAYSFCIKIFSRLPKFKEALMQMHYDIALIKGSPKAALKAIGVSCVAQFLLALTFSIIAVALHQDIPLFYFFIFVPLVCVASSLPSIGGLGVREAGLAFFLGTVGVDTGVSVSIGLITFLFMIMVGLAGGVLFVATKSPLPRTDEMTEIADANKQI